MAIDFQIIYQEAVTHKHIPKLSTTAKDMLKKAIKERLAVNPVSFGKPLQHSLSGHRSLKVGNYRVIYRIDIEQRVVFIIAIGHRKEVYEAF